MRSALLNSRATSHDLICMGVCVDPLRADWSDLTPSGCITFVTIRMHSEVAQVFQFLFFEPADHGSSLPVMSSMHWTR